MAPDLMGRGAGLLNTGVSLKDKLHRPGRQKGECGQSHRTLSQDLSLCLQGSAAQPSYTLPVPPIPPCLFGKVNASE